MLAIVFAENAAFGGIRPPGRIIYSCLQPRV